MHPPIPSSPEYLPFKHYSLPRLLCLPTNSQVTHLPMHLHPWTKNSALKDLMSYFGRTDVGVGVASAGYPRGNPYQFDFYCCLPWTLFLRSQVIVGPTSPSERPMGGQLLPQAASWPCAHE